jgi:glutaminyl-peptide cyclotransferase
MIPSLLLISLLLLFSSCANKKQNDAPQPERAAATVSVPQFDGKQAFRYLTAQTDFGPRNPGSQGHAACLRYFQEELAKFADAVNLQPFTAADYRGTSYRMSNVIASFNLSASDRILLSAHWDTRPWADEDPDPANHTKPILGANDGASGIAVLLELARLLKHHPPPIGVDMVFFDGEDLGIHGSNDHWSLGSKYFARNKTPGFRPRFGINIDMIGDAQLEITREPYSEQFAPAVVRLIFSTARLLGVSQFVDRAGTPTYDDHIPLNEAGIPTANLIDFNYPDASNRYWHTMEDTADKCSPESLEAVGKVLAHIIYSKAQLP